MRMLSRAVLWATTACLAAPAVAAAQAVEITPFVGWMFGGEVRVVDGSLRLQDDVSYGIALDYELNRQVEVGASYTRQDTKLELDEWLVGKRPIYEASVNYWHVGTQYQFDPTATVRPFLGVTVGLTYYGLGTRLDDDAPALDSETRFSAGLGGGVKIFPSERIGIRLAGQLLSTFLSSGAGFWCGTGGCGVGLSGWGVWQGHVSAGVTVAL